MALCNEHPGLLAPPPGKDRASDFASLNPETVDRRQHPGGTPSPEAQDELADSDSWYADLSDLRVDRAPAAEPVAAELVAAEAVVAEPAPGVVGFDVAAGVVTHGEMAETLPSLPAFDEAEPRPLVDWYAPLREDQSDGPGAAGTSPAPDLAVDPDTIDSFFAGLEPASPDQVWRRGDDDLIPTTAPAGGPGRLRRWVPAIRLARR